MKKLIVLATLAALPAVAMADVSISGDLGVSLVNTKAKDGTKTSKNDMNRQTGQIVFKGSEDLGNGLKAVWQVANRVDPSGDESNTVGNRDTFVGLQGAFGQVRFGKLSNPTNSGYGRLEPFQELSIHGDGVGALGEARTANTIRFDSAATAGFSAAISTQLRPEAVSTKTTYTAVAKDDGSAVEVKTNAANPAAPYAVGVGLKYAAGPVVLVYSRATFKDQLVADETTKKQGAKTTVDTVRAEYNEGDLALGFGYAAAKWTDGTTDKESGFGFSAAYALGNVTPKLGYWKEGKLKENGKATQGSYNVVSVGVDYALSKRTSTGFEFQSQGARKDLADGTKSGKKTVSAAYLTHSF